VAQRGKRKSRSSRSVPRWRRFFFLGSIIFLTFVVRYGNQQTALVKSKFVEAIQNYQQVEQQYRQKHKQRMERQFRIGASPSTLVFVYLT